MDQWHVTTQQLTNTRSDNWGGGYRQPPGGLLKSTTGRVGKITRGFNPPPTPPAIQTL